MINTSIKYIVILGITSICSLISCAALFESSGSGRKSNKTINIDYPDNVLGAYSGAKRFTLDNAEDDVYTEKILTYNKIVSADSTIYQLKALTSYDLNSYTLTFVYLVQNTDSFTLLFQKIIANPSNCHIDYPKNNKNAQIISLTLEKYDQTATEFIETMNISKNIGSITISDEFTVFRYGTSKAGYDYYLINIDKLEFVSIEYQIDTANSESTLFSMPATLMKK